MVAINSVKIDIVFCVHHCSTDLSVCIQCQRITFI